jgi:hypothetical protein
VALRPRKSGTMVWLAVARMRHGVLEKDITLWHCDLQNLEQWSGWWWHVSGRLFWREPSRPFEIKNFFNFPLPRDDSLCARMDENNPPIVGDKHLFLGRDSEIKRKKIQANSKMSQISDFLNLSHVLFGSF